MNAAEWGRGRGGEEGTTVSFYSLRRKRAAKINKTYYL